MGSAAEREKQLALVSRLKATYPEIPEWPAPNVMTSDHYWAYMKTQPGPGWSAQRVRALPRTRRKSSGR